MKERKMQASPLYGGSHIHSPKNEYDNMLVSSILYRLALLLQIMMFIFSVYNRCIQCIHVTVQKTAAKEAKFKT